MMPWQIAVLLLVGLLVFTSICYGTVEWMD